jgi:hypothetical protein
MPGLRLPVLSIADPRFERDVGEAAAAVVAVEEIPHGVVGHVDVEIAVVVVVAPNDAQALPFLGVVDARSLRHVGKRPVALVVEEQVRHGQINMRVAVSANVPGEIAAKLVREASAAALSPSSASRERSSASASAILPSASKR